MPLTDLAVRNAKPADKPIRLHDAGGLYLEVSPAGGKWWRWKYRHGGKEKRLSVGVYPTVSLREARERRDGARRLLGNGVDPSDHRKAQKEATRAQISDSFEVIAREWFRAFSPTWATSHSTRIIRRLERDVFPWLGELPIASIAAPQVLAVLRRIEQRGALETAHRALVNCGQVFRYGVATGRCVRDLTPELRGALPPAAQGHFAATTDPTKLGAILRAFEGYEGSFVVRCAMRLAPLVFVRPGELRAAEWSDIDMANAEWRYVVSKTKSQHVVPLAGQALAILSELQPLTGAGRYLFPSARDANRPMSDNALLAAMRRMGIGKEEMTGHGFRAVARTILDEVLGFRPDFIEHQLAHAVRDPNGRAYNRTAHLPERRQMMQSWADYLEALTRTCPGA